MREKKLLSRYVRRKGKNSNNHKRSEIYWGHSFVGYFIPSLPLCPSGPCSTTSFFFFLPQINNEANWGFGRVSQNPAFKCLEYLVTVIKYLASRLFYSTVLFILLTRCLKAIAVKNFYFASKGNLSSRRQEENSSNDWCLRNAQ